MVGKSDDNELLSAAHFALLDAVKRYDPKRNDSIKAWAVVCVKRAIWKVISSNNRREKTNVNMAKIAMRPVVNIHELIDKLPVQDKDFAYDTFVTHYPIIHLAQLHKSTVFAVRLRIRRLQNELMEIFDNVYPL